MSANAIPEEFEGMHAAGFTARQIAEELGLTLQYVYQLHRTLDLKPNAPKNKGRFSPQLVDTIIAQYQDQTISIKSILDNTGLTHLEMYSILNRHGIQSRQSTNEYAEVRKVMYDKALEMYQKGIRMHEIVAETGVCLNKLYSLIAVSGIGTRRERRAETIRKYLDDRERREAS